MAAPTVGPLGTTATIFDPAGADTNPIGGAWVTDITVTTPANNHSDWKRLSNQLAPGSNKAAAQAYNNSTTFGVGGEVWCEVPAKGATNGHYLDLYMMLATPNTAGLDGYGVEITVDAGADLWSLYRFFNAVATFPLPGGTASQEIAAGDYIGLTVTLAGTGDPLISAYHWPLAGSTWNMKATYTDSTASKVQANGYIGLEATVNSAWRVGKIYGGVIPTIPFPTPANGPYGTTAVIYDPTGADTDPIADGWTTGYLSAGMSNWKRLSNVMAPTSSAAGEAQAYRAGASYGMDSEYWLQMPAKGANTTHLNLVAMIASPGSSPNYYQLTITAVAGVDTWDLWRINAGAGTSIVTGTTFEVSVGDWVALSIRNNGSGSPTLKVWTWSDSWTEIISFTDSSGSKLTTSGHFGVGASLGSAWRVGEIMGGTIATPGTSGPKNLLLMGVG